MILRKISEESDRHQEQRLREKTAAQLHFLGRARYPTGGPSDRDTSSLDLSIAVAEILSGDSPEKIEFIGQLRKLASPTPPITKDAETTKPVKSPNPAAKKIVRPTCEADMFAKFFVELSRISLVVNEGKAKVNRDKKSIVNSTIENIKGIICRFKRILSTYGEG